MHFQCALGFVEDEDNPTELRNPATPAQDSSDGSENVQERGEVMLANTIARTIYYCSETLESLCILGPYYLDGFTLALGQQWFYTLDPSDTSPYKNSFNQMLSATQLDQIMPLAHPPKTIFSKLSHFSSTLPTCRNPAMANFIIHACPNVTSWSATGYEDDCTRILDPLVFPKLTAFGGGPRDIYSIISTRPVHEISIDHPIDSYGDLDRLVVGLTLIKPMVNITKLTITVDLVRYSSNFFHHPEIPRFQVENARYKQEHRLFHSLSHAIPHLQRLELINHLDDQHSNHESSWEELGRLMFSKWLMEMKELEEFVWWDVRAKDWKEEVVAMLRKMEMRQAEGDDDQETSLISLRKVTFGREGFHC